MDDDISVRKMPVRIILQAIRVGIAIWMLVNYEKSIEEED